MSAMTEQQATAPSQTVPGKRVAQGRATRGQLIEVATSLFAERGYEGTSIEAVLAAAGVSRGALYHHFAGKEALFTAVLQAISGRITVEITEAVRDCTDPVDAMHTGALAWIDLAGDPVIQRVMLVDAPSVLGWEQWRAMEEHHALGLIRTVLQVIADEGKTRPELVGTMAHVLLASVNEVALLVARSDDKEAAMQAGADTIDELLRRLFNLPAHWSGWVPRPRRQSRVDRRARRAKGHRNVMNLGFHHALTC